MEGETERIIVIELYGDNNIYISDENSSGSIYPGDKYTPDEALREYLEVNKYYGM